MRKMRWLHPVRVAVAVALVLALAGGPALAAPGLGVLKKLGLGFGPAKGGPPWLSSWFSDVSADHWALGDISTVAAKGVMKGYGKGLFGPRNHVTRLEIVVLATRLMGFEDEALALDPLEVAALPGSTFTDYPAIPAWPGAHECLAYALQHGYLWPLMQGGDGPVFRANAPAKRVEVIVILLEAAGLGPEAAERLGAPILFKDADSVPPWAWGYVALAIELGILRGYDGKLHLNKPVTRAETAALLNRLDDLIQTPADRRIVEGTVAGVDIPADPAVASTITIIPDTSGGLPGSGGEETYELAPAVAVILDGEPADLTEVTPGLHVALYLDRDGKVLLIHGETESEPSATEVVGMVLVTAHDETGSLTGLTLWVDEKVRVYLVSPEVVITVDGEEAPASAVVPGLTVRVTLEDGVVVAIAIGEEPSEEPPEEEKVTGMVLETDLTPDGELAGITLWHDGEAETFTAADEVEITRDGEEVPAAELEPGLTVTLTVVGGEVVKVVIGEEPPEVTEVEGLIVEVFLTSDGRLASIILWHDGVAETFEAAAEVDITLDGEPVGAGDISRGRTARLTLTDGMITAVVLDPTSDEVTTVEGTVTRVTLGTGTVPELGATISIIPEGGEVADEETYDVAPDVTVTVNGEPAALGEVRPGDHVVLELNVQDQVTVITATYTVSEVSGTVVGVVVDAGGKLMTLTIDTGEEHVTFAVDPSAKVYHDGVEVEHGEVAAGDTVTVLVARGMVTTVTITAKAGE